MTDYEFLTELGLCHMCRKNKVAPNKKYCFDCLDKIRERNARKDKEKARKYNEEYKERRRELYKEKKEKGICVRCRNQATKGIYCLECSVKVKRRQKNRANEEKNKRHDRGLVNEYRRMNHLCLWCGEKAMEGRLCCKKHSEIFSAAGKRGAIIAREEFNWI